MKQYAVTYIGMFKKARVMMVRAECEEEARVIWSMEADDVYKLIAINDITEIMKEIEEMERA